MAGFWSDDDDNIDELLLAAAEEAEKDIAAEAQSSELASTKPKSAAGAAARVLVPATPTPSPPPPSDCSTEVLQMMLPEKQPMPAGTRGTTPQQAIIVEDADDNDFVRGLPCEVGGDRADTPPKPVLKREPCIGPFGIGPASTSRIVWRPAKQPRLAMQPSAAIVTRFGPPTLPLLPRMLSPATTPPPSTSTARRPWLHAAAGHAAAKGSNLTASPRAPDASALYTMAATAFEAGACDGDHLSNSQSSFSPSAAATQQHQQPESPRCTTSRLLTPSVPLHPADPVPTDVVATAAASRRAYRAMSVLHLAYVRNAPQLKMMMNSAWSGGYTTQLAIVLYTPDYHRQVNGVDKMDNLCH